MVTNFIEFFGGKGRVMKRLRMFSSESPLSILFGLCSAIGLLFTVVYAGASLWQSKGLNLEVIAIILTLAVVNSLLALMLYVLSRNHHDLQKEKFTADVNIVSSDQRILDIKNNLKFESDKSKEIAYISHNILDELRNKMALVLELYEELLVDEIPADRNKVMDMVRINKSFSMYTINNIKDLFDNVTNDNCSACIKLTNGSDDESEPYISTFIRDTRSFRSRYSAHNKKFSWHDNSSFKDIISSDISQSYFASDDLKNEKGYVNVNPGWNKCYNATLVVPLRLGMLTNYDTRLDNSVMGFLCVDNFKGGFDNETSINLLSGIADSLYLYFYYYGKLMNLVQKLNEMREDSAIPPR